MSADRPSPGGAPGAPGAPGSVGTARRRPPGWVLPAVLGVVLTVSLAVGSGIGQGHPSAAQRARAIEAVVRCPSCEDLSVLDSSASSAVAVRNQIVAEVAAGWSDSRIEDALVARYGGTILLRPAATGLTAVVWIVPAVAGAGALGAVGVLFWRRSRAMASLVREGR